MIETTIGWLLLYSVLASIMMVAAYGKIKDNGYQSGYWTGRKDGYDMHRRMIQNKQLTGQIFMTTKKDEVFDYDNHN